MLNAGHLKSRHPGDYGYYNALIADKANSRLEQTYATMAEWKLCGTGELIAEIELINEEGQAVEAIT